MENIDAVMIRANQLRSIEMTKQSKRRQEKRKEMRMGMGVFPICFGIKVMRKKPSFECHTRHGLFL